MLLDLYVQLFTINVFEMASRGRKEANISWGLSIFKFSYLLSHLTLKLVRLWIPFYSQAAESGQFLFCFSHKVRQWIIDGRGLCETQMCVSTTISHIRMNQHYSVNFSRPCKLETTHLLPYLLGSILWSCKEIKFLLRMLEIIALSQSHSLFWLLVQLLINEGNSSLMVLEPFSPINKRLRWNLSLCVSLPWVWYLIPNLLPKTISFCCGFKIQND